MSPVFGRPNLQGSVIGGICLSTPQTMSNIPGCFNAGVCPPSNITGPVAGAVCGAVVFTTVILVIVYCKRNKTSRETNRNPQISDQLEADEPYFDMTENPMYDRTNPQTGVLHESQNVNQSYQGDDATSGTANENTNFANFERLGENTCENNSRTQTEGFPMYSTVKPMRKL